MKNLFSIGEVSKIKKITIKALRYYHKMGILIPSYVDEETGYRYYSIDQFVHIDIIKGCRSLGTSIKELQEIFKECNTDKLLEFLEVKKDKAEENIKKMKEIIKNIDDLNETVKTSRRILENDEITTKFFHERHIIIAPCKEAGSLKELLYYSDLERVIQDKDIKISLDRGIMYEFNSNGKINPLYVFNVIDVEENTDIDLEDNIKILPKGKYLTLNYSKNNENERIRKVINYAKEHNLKIKNFIEMELFNEIFNTDSYNCQIQILVEDSN